MVCRDYELPTLGLPREQKLSVDIGVSIVPNIVLNSEPMSIKLLGNSDCS